MKKHLILAAALLIMAACSKSDLKETQYIEDPDYPGLPIYSDMGYNTYGAYMNDQVYQTSTNYGSNRKFYLVADREGLSMTFYGWLDGHNLSMVFDLPIDTTFAMDDYHDLLKLDGMSFAIDTTGTTCRVKMEGTNAPEIASIYSGKITFDHVRQVVVDKEDKEIIVSGKFQFRAFTTDGARLDVTGGRFDLGVDNTNFVNFRD
ncbi:MAG: hypothetical protein IJ057_04230 [Bacteroidales bacterium]|nr:hypothetical protein [Bacteroidales bacterium]